MTLTPAGADLWTNGGQVVPFCVKDQVRLDRVVIQKGPRE